jgi:quinol-cytochrome oxidoreductase complex cytochrome b subunit/coenzyme F420-reducing hydrogenase delta subunit/NAD-dependent dihydropyrimidine dehydrogenase PreA subunit
MTAAAAPLRATGREGAVDALRRAWRALERRLDAAVGEHANPLRHLGAIGFALFWLLAVSGIYLYVVIDTSAAGAWPSIDELSRSRFAPGGLLRSLHRYAADAFAVVIALHLLREALFGRFRGFRRFTWLTGVPVLAFSFVAAVGGFWLNWDQLGQYSAVATAELLDALPMFSTPFVRNFLDAAAVSDRLFSLFVFVHLGVPLLLVFALWFHVQRLSRAEVFPPRPLAWALGLALLALALAWPVRSHAPADLSREPLVLAYDWWLLAIHPLTRAISAEAVWVGIALVFGALLMLPWLPARAAQAPVAVVDADNCNGCRRCFDDCPYAAVTMVPHPNQRIGRFMAVVDADLCASCGVCAGACPSATPFRRAAELVTGIDMPSAPVGALRLQLKSGLQAAAAAGVPAVAVFGCERGADVTALAGPGVVALPLMCTGALPPSFVEYALRDGAASVLVAACRGCEYRHGSAYTAARLAGTREPHLRAQVPRDRVHFVAADAGEEPLLRAALQRLAPTAAIAGAVDA